MKSELWFDKTVSFWSPYFGKIICSLYWHLLRGYSFMIGFESFDYTLWLSEKIPATFLQNVSWLQTFSRLLVLLMPDWLVILIYSSAVIGKSDYFSGHVRPGQQLSQLRKIDIQRCSIVKWFVLMSNDHRVMTDNALWSWRSLHFASVKLSFVRYYR